MDRKSEHGTDIYHRNVGLRCLEYVFDSYSSSVPYDISPITSYETLRRSFGPCYSNDAC